MKQPNLEEIISYWDYENNGIPPEESTLAARLEILTYRTLAEGHPVSVEHLAAAAGVPVEITKALFEYGKKLGGEWDSDGRLLGNVLTLIPTQHHFNVNGHKLYTWCSLDALHLPGLLDQTAQVESTDPVSGEKIHMTVPPDGVPEYDPPGTLLSIVLSAGDRGGPQSPLCRQMHFFASRETAETWVKDHPDATIMTIEEVYQLVREHVLAPLEKPLQQLN